MQKMRTAIQIGILTSLLMCSAQALDWKKRYKTFNTEVPSKELEPVLVKIFNTKLTDLDIKDASIVVAVDKLNRFLKVADDGGALSFIVHGGESKGRVTISEKTITFGDALDMICSQAGYRWDFPLHGKLTITPNKK